MALTNIRFRVEDEADYESAVQAADTTTGTTLEAVTEPGQEVEEAIAPIIAVLIGVAVLAAGKFVVDLIDRLKGGVVIDLRADAEDDIYRDKALPYGYVLVKPMDGGDVKIDVKDAPKDMVERLLGEVVNGALKSVASVAAAAESALGKEKVQVS